MKKNLIGTHNSVGECQKHAEQKNPDIKDNRTNLQREKEDQWLGGRRFLFQRGMSIFL